MLDLQLANQARRDVFKVKKNVLIRASDGTVQFSRMDGNLNRADEKAGDDLAVWVEVGVIQENAGLKNPAVDTLKVMVAAAGGVKNDETIFEARWKKKLRSQAKGWWSKLSDSDLDLVGGKFDQLIRLLQVKYGYTRKQAEAEYLKRTK